MNEGQERTVLDQLQQHVKPLPPTNLVRQSEIFGKKERKRQGFGPMVWMGLVATFLIISVFAAYYIKTSPPAKEEVAVSGPRQDLREVLDQFLEQAERGGVMSQAAHQALFAYLQTLREEDLPTYVEWKAYLGQKEIPESYRHFLEVNLTRYMLKDSILVSRKGLHSIVDNNILLFYPTSPDQKVKLEIVNDEKPYAYSISKASTNKLPAGLTIVDGSVMNPVINESTGIVIIDKQGNIRIHHIDQLGGPFSQMNITASLDDYQRFLIEAQNHGADVFQGDLFIFEGQAQSHSLHPYPDYIFFLSNDGTHYLYRTNGSKNAVSHIINRFGAIRGIGLYENGANYQLVFE